jgi:hypothetical protein
MAGYREGQLTDPEKLDRKGCARVAVCMVDAEHISQQSSYINQTVNKTSARSSELASSSNHACRHCNSGINKGNLCTYDT